MAILLAQKMYPLDAVILVLNDRQLEQGSHLVQVNYVLVGTTCIHRVLTLEWWSI